MPLQKVNLLISLLIIIEVNGLNKIDENYVVCRQLCIPKKYDMLEPPENPKVLFNMLTNTEAVKQVDEHMMTITFEPTYILIWEDPRLELCNQSYIYDNDVNPLPDAAIERIWSPKITITNVITKRASSFRDPDSYGKAILSFVLNQSSISM